MTELLGGVLAATLMIGLIVIVRSFRPAPERRRDPIGDIDPRTLQLTKWISAQIFITAFVWYASDWPSLAAGVGAMVWVFRLWLIANQERTNYHLTTEAISVWVDMVKDSLGGGAGLSQAIETTTAVAPDAIRPAVARLASRQRTGSQTGALREFGDNLAHPTSDLVVLALISASENQARDLPKLLAKTAEQARSRNEAVLEIETERSQLYAEARAMVLAIAFLGLIISIIARDFLEPYSRPLGQFVLAIIMVMVVGSAAMLVQAGRPRADARLLSATGVGR
jgi:Flp pilus assembly protein TadB